MTADDSPNPASGDLLQTAVSAEGGQPLDLLPTESPVVPEEAPADVRVVWERRVAVIVAALAAGMLVLAVLLNWANRPKLVGAGVDPAQVGAFLALGEGPNIKLPVEPSKMLPTEITAYEAIDSHPVPGQEKYAAEAVYATYNVNLVQHIPMSVYAHVQGYNSAMEAETALSELMSQYPVKAKKRLVGPAQAAREGYNAKETALMVAWTKGQYVTYVKTFFSQYPPAQKKKFLANMGEPVVLAVEHYERTGKQGSIANAEIYRQTGGKGSAITSSPVGTTDITR